MHTDFSVYHSITACQTDNGSSPLPRLSEGGSFFVRIVRAVSPGVYEASINGRLLRVRSDLSLAVGQSFYATATANNTNLQLSIQPQQYQPDIAMFLRQNNLPDSPALRTVLAVLVTLGVRLDPRLIKRALAVSSSFTGRGARDTDTAEAAAVLLSKDIEPDDEAIQGVLDFDHFGEDHDSHNTDDVLQRFNKAHSKNNNWIAVPFALPANIFDQKINGCIRLLCDEKLRVVKKCAVTITTALRMWTFDIDQNHATTNVNAYAEPELSDATVPLFDDAVKAFLESPSGSVLSSIKYCRGEYARYAGATHE